MIAGNHAKQGGAITCSLCDLIVLHQSDFFNNTVAASSEPNTGSGGAIYAGGDGFQQYGLMFVMVDTVFRGNRAA